MGPREGAPLAGERLIAIPGKILLLGGTGYVGRPTARFLAASDAVGALTIAARDLPRACVFAATLGPKATTAQVDAADQTALEGLMPGHDLVVNVSGGAARLIPAVLRAAIAARVPYCDTTGGDAAEECLALDGAARAAGVLSLTGAGVTPGTTNLLARHLADGFDSVEAIHSCFIQGVLHWVDPIIAAGGAVADGMAATVESIITGVGSRVRVYRDGRLTDIEGPGPAVELRLPGAGGRNVTGHPYGNAEILTLPKSIAGVRDITCLAGFQPQQLNALLREQARRFGTGEASAEEASAAFLSTIVANPDHWLAGARGARKITPFTVLTGIKDGRPARHTATLASRYESDPEPAGAYTAGPLSVAAEMMLRGEVPGTGVLPPEACLDPMRFISALARLWVPAPVDRKPIVETIEWLD